MLNFLLVQKNFKAIRSNTILNFKEKILNSIVKSRPSQNATREPDSIHEDLFCSSRLI
jgi:hypothetical protein